MRKNVNKTKSRPKTRGGISHPPQLDGINIKHSTTIRYRVTSAANVIITFQNLLDTLLVATSAAVGVDLFQTVRIREVAVWGMPVIGSASSIALEFAGLTAGVTGDQVIHTDTSMGVQPAHVRARPSGKSLASNYQLSSAAVAFILNCPAGSVVDVSLSFRSTAFGTAPTAAQNALSAATTGAIYIRGLDGLATATSNFVPEYTDGKI